MQTIKSKSQLPDWFKNKIYSKNLTSIDWYREIFDRKLNLGMIEMRESLGHTSDKNNTSLMSLFLRDSNKKSPLYKISQHGKPIQPLSVFEASYLSIAAESDDLENFKQRLQNLLKMWKVEINRIDESPVFSYQYEVELEDFIKDISSKEFLFLDVLGISEIGNPFFSYDRPLNGTPVTIDTQFDDKTIIESVKEWLQLERVKMKEKAKRPFNQNDFDDWTYYKIREVCDLDNWSKISGIKILDKVIADTLWPYSDGDISPIDILRTTSRKKVQEIFNHQTAVRFYGQLVMQEGENFLDK